MTLTTYVLFFIFNLIVDSASLNRRSFSSTGWVNNSTSNSSLPISCLPNQGFSMNSTTVSRLAERYCEDLRDNYPVLMGNGILPPLTRTSLTGIGGRFDGAAYLCDLEPPPGDPEDGELERSGIIMGFSFSRFSGKLINNTIVVSGSKEQCERDSCVGIFHAIVNKCK